MLSSTNDVNIIVPQSSHDTSNTNTVPPLLTIALDSDSHFLQPIKRDPHRFNLSRIAKHASGSSSGIGSFSSRSDNFSAWSSLPNNSFQVSFNQQTSFDPQTSASNDDSNSLVLIYRTGSFKRAIEKTYEPKLIPQNYSTHINFNNLEISKSMDSKVSDLDNIHVLKNNDNYCYPKCNENSDYNQTRMTNLRIVESDKINGENSVNVNLMEDHYSDKESKVNNDLFLIDKIKKEEINTQLIKDSYLEFNVLSSIPENDKKNNDDNLILNIDRNINSDLIRLSCKDVLTNKKILEKNNLIMEENENYYSPHQLQIYFKDDGHELSTCSKDFLELSLKDKNNYSSEVAQSSLDMNDDTVINYASLNQPLHLTNNSSITKIKKTAINQAECQINKGEEVKKKDEEFKFTENNIGVRASEGFIEQTFGTHLDDGDKKNSNDIDLSQSKKYDMGSKISNIGINRRISLKKTKNNADEILRRQLVQIEEQDHLDEKLCSEKPILQSNPFNDYEIKVKTSFQDEKSYMSISNDQFIKDNFIENHLKKDANNIDLNLKNMDFSDTKNAENMDVSTLEENLSDKMAKFTKKRIDKTDSVNNLNLTQDGLQKLLTIFEDQNYHPNNGEVIDINDIEEKITLLSLTFKTDSETVEKRLALHLRERDLAELNAHSEIALIRQRIDILDNYENNTQFLEIKKGINVLEQLIERVAAKAELFGAIQQEERFRVMMEAMIKYLEFIKISYEKDHSELAYLRRTISDKIDNVQESNLSSVDNSSKSKLYQRRATMAIPNSLSLNLPDNCASNRSVTSLPSTQNNPFGCKSFKCLDANVTKSSNKGRKFSIFN